MRAEVSRTSRKPRLQLPAPDLAREANCARMTSKRLQGALKTPKSAGNPTISRTLHAFGRRRDTVTTK